MDAKLFDNSHTLRTSVLTGLSLFLTAIALFFATLNITYHQAYLLAALELIFAFHSAYIYRLTKKDRHSFRHIQGYVYFLVGIIIVSTYLQPIGNGVFLWCLFCPILLYVLLGLKQGQLMTGVVLIIQVISIFHQSSPQAGYNVWTTLTNLIACYSGIWIIAHTYEFNRNKIENTLTYLASRDSLTGAHNRLSLNSAFQHFTHNKDASSSLCLLILDLDYFKQINDEFGHDAGDKVLMETSHLLANIVGDNNVYRIGGEEFCITLFDHSLSQAEHIGERLRNIMANHLFSHHNKRIQLTLSVGICEYRDGDKLNELIKLADLELYRAKKNGRNQVRICQTSETTEYRSSQVDTF
ncbi:GGDEF domain-containing protein [Vibrio cincinnatiensis]|uniref:GGDEF domain-containing protein n=1 Tax=Vibrio cincinnatiensis TaxID=675 RepID=UPI001EDD05FC|nr:GGDEF domain-containing protein [Vibrio cincinnatiensis]MCG3727281.1 GGDEF domain-containing protein [Vibrio cincinnatiensis]